MPTNRRPRSPHQVLASTSRSAVLEVLRERATALDVDEVASAVGLHVNTVRGHLEVLVDGGYAVRRSLPPSGPGRPRTVYEATAAPEDGSNYRLLAEVLTHYLASTSAHPAADAVAAGRSWAAPQVEGVAAPDRGATGPTSERDAVAAVVKLLADSGFRPEASADGSRIDLHHCPFRDLAVASPDVVCGAHLGILQGALAQLDAPIAATRLLPLVEPDLCVATLERTPTPPPSR
ncbi:MAG: helix-turn-helix transcriptional regulator [Angustibacter sp.]